MAIKVKANASCATSKASTGLDCRYYERITSRSVFKDVGCNVFKGNEQEEFHGLVWAENFCLTSRPKRSASHVAEIGVA